jgi:hypothetical protein
VWIGFGQKTGEHAPSPRQAPRQVAYAPAEPDVALVRRAWDQVRDIYGERGVEGLLEVVEGCPSIVASRPELLDFCLAFALDSAPLIDSSDDAMARRVSETLLPDQLTLIQSALPRGANTSKRLADVQLLNHTILQPQASDEAAGKRAPPPTADLNPPRTAVSHEPGQGHAKSVRAHVSKHAHHKRPAKRIAEEPETPAPVEPVAPHDEVDPNLPPY